MERLPGVASQRKPVEDWQIEGCRQFVGVERVSLRPRSLIRDAEGRDQALRRARRQPPPVA